MKYLAALALPVLAAASPLAFQAAAATPPTGNITIGSVSTSGNGCPSGTVTTEISPDRTVSLTPFTIGSGNCRNGGG